MAPKIFSTLSRIQNLAEHLSERHLLQQYRSKEHGLALTRRIDSAFRDLEQCVEMLNACAPISQLPADILGLVFDAAQEEDYFRYPMDPSASIEPSPSVHVPISLSQVSRSWRNVTTNLPLLWTLVKISSPWQFQSIRTSLSMSKSLPIHIKIIDIPEQGIDSESIEDDVDKEEEHAKFLCDILVPHIPRCRSISVISENKTWPLLVEMRDRFRSLEAPILERAELVCEDFNLEYGPQLLFARAPLLVALRLDIQTLTICYPPLSHIVSLHLTASFTTPITPHQFFHALSQCLVLEHLYLYGEVVDDDDFIVTNHSLSTLRTLHFYGDTDYTRTGVLSHIVAPVLDVMLLYPFYSISDNYVENLASEQEEIKRFPSLKTLYLVIEDADDRWFVEVAWCFPSVENLVLGGESGKLVLGALTKHEYSRELPDLRSLSLRNIKREGEDELCKFISLRQAANISLPKISLNSTSLVNMRRLDWLEMQVEVMVGDPWLDQEERFR